MRRYFVLPLVKTAEGIDLRGRDLSQRKISSSKLLCTDKNADSQNAVGIFVGLSPSPMAGLKFSFYSIAVLLCLATRTGRICTTLRGPFLFRTTFGVRLSSRLGRLVCALLRFRERPRTIEVQRTTSSPQNHRKSLAQYFVVLFI